MSVNSCSDHMSMLTLSGWDNSTRGLDSANATLLDDGWGRATWAGNVQTIVTASRKCLAIYDIQGKPVRLQSPNLGISGTPHWILDVLVNPVDSTLVFVLTSTSLFCLRVRCLDEFDPESYSTAGAEVVLQCRHFRDPEDIGLGLSSHVDNEGRLPPPLVQAFGC